MAHEIRQQADEYSVAVIDPAPRRAQISCGPNLVPPTGSPARSWLSTAWQVGMLTVSVVLLVLFVGGIKFQSDFNGDLYIAGLKILHGVNPYNLVQLDHQAAVISSGGPVVARISPRWPAPVLLGAVPLSLLPVDVADVLFMLICLGSVILALRLVGVRDSRCVLVALVSGPTVLGTVLGNVSPLIMLGLAICWRSRSRSVVSGISTALVVIGKLFLWPLGFWLLLTQRRRALALGGAAAMIAVLAGWSVIGISGLPLYPRVLLDVAKIGEGRGCSLVAFLMYAGVPVTAARLLALTAALALLTLAVAVVRHPRGEAHAFGLVIVAALTATPVVWSHYLVVLFVPIALLSPTLSWLWFLPALGAFAPLGAVHSFGLWLLPIFGAELALVGTLCKPLLAEPVSRYWRSIVAMASAALPS